MKTKEFLNIHWLIGFIDGDGYFGLEKVKRKRYGKIDIFYRPILAISQNDINVLYKIKFFIECGSVSAKGKSKKHFHYRIRSAKMFETNFFPLMQNYKFQTNKQVQFEILKEIVVFLNTQYSPQNKNHNLFLETLDQKLRHAKTLDYLNNELINLNWFIGFFEAEGTFYFNIKKTTTKFLIKVTQKNQPLLLKIQEFFGYGTIQKERQGIYYFGFTNQKDLKKIASIFEKTKFYSQKNISRIKWLKAYEIVVQSKSENVTIPKSQIQELLELKQTLNKN